jgi:AcrR family transcriptional regulator
LPRANLSPAKILDRAVHWVDIHGYEQLSMAALAQTFGVAVPSLYKHVPSLAWIRRGIAEHGLRELGDAFQQAAAGRHQEEALRHMAQAYREYAKGHPGRYAAIQRAPNPGDTDLQRLSEHVLCPIYETLETYGRTGDQATHDVRLLRAALHGFVSLEMAGGFGMPLNIEESFEHLIAALDTTFRSNLR